MKNKGGLAVLGSASLVAIALTLSPASATSAQKNGMARAAPSLSSGTFTPAVSDPRLAAALQARGQRSGAFRLTPSASAGDRGRQVRVAVRAKSSSGAAEPSRSLLSSSSASAITAITPSSYNLGVSVGWRRFAITGDVAETQGGALPGSRESARVGVDYAAAPRITGRVQLQAERAEGLQRIVSEDVSYALDVGGSYSIARNLDVTGGVRYKISRDRLEPLADERRDSQAVYVGTAFRF